MKPKQRKDFDSEALEVYKATRFASPKGYKIAYIKYFQGKLSKPAQITKAERAINGNSVEVAMHNLPQKTNNEFPDPVFDSYVEIALIPVDDSIATVIENKTEQLYRLPMGTKVLKLRVGDDWPFV